MPIPFDELRTVLSRRKSTWLVTGAAGFIGSNLVEQLLRLGQKVIGFDNFATGHQANLDDIRSIIDTSAWMNFTFIEGDIRDLPSCRRATEGVEYVLHQAALGSVPRSIEDPVTSTAVNINGFINMLVAARDAKVKQFVYASSSSVYGDNPELPKREENIGNPLSPYALTKYANELYANLFSSHFGMSCIGLRYFNVFGPRQDPAGAYAAVIPRWIGQMFQGQQCTINGDGETTRDFCYIDNVVQANILAAMAEDGAACNQVYNIAAGGRTSLNELYKTIYTEAKQLRSEIGDGTPRYVDFRMGDVRHSLANIDKAKRLLAYEPTVSVREGLKRVVQWFGRG